MGIPLSTSFDVGTNLPLDARLVKADITARNAIAAGSRYEGMPTFVIATQKNYQLRGGIADANWVELVDTGGGVSKVGTPVTEQIGVWTGDGTIQGTSALTFNTTIGLHVSGANSNIFVGGANIQFDFKGSATNNIGVSGPVSANHGDAIKLTGGAAFATGAYNGGDIFIYGGDKGSTGNVGRIFIGTGSAGVYPLVGSGTGTSVILYNRTTGQLTYGDMSAGGSSQWTTTGSDIYFPNKVMIGSTAAPLGTLDIYATSPVIYFRHASALKNWAIITSPGTDYNKLEFWVSTADNGNPISAGLAIATLTNTGLFGLGTTAPVVVLQVAGAANGQPANTGTAQPNASLRLGNNITGRVLDIGQDGSVGSWLQVSLSSDLSTHYPLLLNPLGGYVRIGGEGANGLQLNTNQIGISGNADFYVNNYSAGNGNVHLGKTSGTITVENNLYVVSNCSALSFTDRTPFYEGDAISEIKSIKGKNGKIDHTTLPSFAKVKRKVIIDKKEVEQDERDLGAMISIHTKALQELIERLERLENLTI